jgi:drug/metabolite transporter (DMT)-like permease
MSIGILMCILGALSFGLLACVSKIAERKKCNSSGLVVWLFGWASLAMLGRSLTTPNLAHLTIRVIALAALLGIFAAVAYFAFQISITIGKVTVGWLMMNLSAGIPALASIWLYKEKLTHLKTLAFALAALSLLCLFFGNRAETRGTNLTESR